MHPIENFILFNSLTNPYSFKAQHHITLPHLEPVKPSEEPVKTVAQDSAIDKKRAQVGSILSGEIPITLKSQFLIRKNSSDMLVLKNCKVCHSDHVCEVFFCMVA